MQTVSVVIPCYRYGHYVRACVESVLAQNMPVEVLIIDDASDDDSEVVCRELADEYSDVECIVHTSNLGHIQTYNEGLDRARGEFICLLSADDRLAPGSLLRAVRTLNELPRSGFVYGRVTRFSDGEPQRNQRNESVSQRPPRFVSYSGQRWLTARFRDATSCIASPEVIVRTSAQRVAGYYNADLPHTADLEMWMRLAMHYDVAYVRGSVQAYYRVHRSSMSAGYYSRGIADLQERAKTFSCVAAELEGRLGVEMRAAAYRGLALEALRRARRAIETGTADAEYICQLTTFAENLYPEAPSLRQWRSIQLRRSLDPRLARASHYVLPAAYVDRIRDIRWWHSVEKRGL